MLTASGAVAGARTTSSSGIFSTGEIVYGAKAADVYARIDSYDDALAHVRRIKAQGGHSVKNYNQPRREQRQQVAAASRAENMLDVAEGGSLFGMDMSLIADGISTLEQAIEDIKASITKAGGDCQVKMAPRAVTENDDAELAALMEKRERENQQVSGDEDESSSDEGEVGAAAAAATTEA